MRTVPLEHDETARSYRWRQFAVFHPARPVALLCLHSRLKVRVKSWQHPSMRLVEEARFARIINPFDKGVVSTDTLRDPDADFVSAVLETVS